jgi:uncharacterized membrane protein/thiol-disulfide isomerase/thioredoxin
LALQVPIDTETLSQLPKHFIAQIKTEHSEDFAVVTNKGLQYEIHFGNKKKVIYTLDEFMEKFTGIMLAVEKDKAEELHHTSGSSLIIQMTIFGLVALSMLVIWMLSHPDLSTSLFLIASLLGIYISISIYKQEQGERTSLSEAFCSGESEKSNCDSVINSKGANLFGLLKLSDLSLVYFAGLSVFTYIVAITDLSLNIAYVIALFAVVITLYSIYYQAFAVKAWCGLCLSIVGVLWIQAIIVLIQFDRIRAFSFSVKEVFFGVLSFSIVSVIWLYLKPNIELLKELKEEKIKYFKFKRNFNLFNTLLEKTDKINTQLSAVSEIVFGDKENTLSIVIITNPFCGHCKSVHTLVEKIHKKYNDLVNITIRFNISLSNKKSDLVKITSRLLELYQQEESISVMQAMHDIYGGQESVKWFEKWGKSDEPDNYIEVLEKESTWCKNNNINFTPEILIEGQSFPKEYNRGDLEYFIEDLYEKKQEDIETQTLVYQEE